MSETHPHGDRTTEKRNDNHGQATGATEDSEGSEIVRRKISLTRRMAHFIQNPPANYHDDNSSRLVRSSAMDRDYTLDGADVDRFRKMLTSADGLRADISDPHKVSEECPDDSNNSKEGSPSLLTPLVAVNLGRVYQEGMIRSAIGVRIIGHLKSSAQQLCHIFASGSRGSFVESSELQALTKESTLGTTDPSGMTTTSPLRVTISIGGDQ